MDYSLFKRLQKNRALQVGAPEPTEEELQAQYQQQEGSSPAAPSEAAPKPLKNMQEELKLRQMVDSPKTSPEDISAQSDKVDNRPAKLKALASEQSSEEPKESVPGLVQKLQATKPAADEPKTTTLDSQKQSTTTKQSSMAPGTLLKPESVDKFWEQYNSKLQGLSEKDRGALTADASKLEKAQTEALQAFKQNQRDTRMLEIAERIGQAMAQLGAAQQGLKTGVDMSGLKFDKADWKTQYDQNMQELNAKLADIKDRRGDLRSAERNINEREKEYGRALSEDYDRRSRGYQQQELERLRGSQRQEIASAENASREAIAAEKAAGRGGSGEDKRAKALDEAANLAKTIAGTKNEKERLKLRDDLAKALGRAEVSDVDIPGEQDINQGGFTGLFSSKPDAKASYGKLAEELTKRAASARGGEASAPSEKATVRIQAPDGTIAEVPKEKAQKYIDKGGKLVQ